MKPSVTILGAGESGVGAALLAKQKGYAVFVSDYGDIAGQYREELISAEIPFEQGQHTLDKILESDHVVISPGIPLTIGLVDQIRERNIELISEIEFASRFSQSRIIAITGTNGKTTTTLLTHHLMKEAGKKVALGGNIGRSFARLLVEDGDSDFTVLEVSSFQLDTCRYFKPEIAVLLNITPDHLNRYDNDIKNYIESKFRISMNQSSKDTFIYYNDDPNIKSYLEHRQFTSTQLPISVNHIQDDSIDLTADGITFYVDEYDLKLANEQLPLIGEHNRVNIAAAVGATLKMGAEPELIRDGLRTFRNAAHRLEDCGEINGVKFINDSKATNIDAVYYALDGIDKPIIWIAGGVDKGNDYSALTPLVQEKVKGIVSLGQNNEKLENHFGDEKLFKTASMSQAVREAFKMAREGYVILLSPACASFDLFQNYEDRGEQFKSSISDLVQSLESL